VGSHDIAALVDPQGRGAALRHGDVDHGVVLGVVAPAMHEAVLGAVAVPVDSHGLAAVIDAVELGLNGAGDVDRRVVRGGPGPLIHEAMYACGVGEVSDDGAGVVDPRGPRDVGAGDI